MGGGKAAAMVAGLLLVVPAVAQREPPAPKELLDRTSAWVERFVAGYHSLAAEETLVQVRYDRRGRPGAERRVVSDYLLLRLPPHGELTELRDAVEVDDRELQSDDARRRKWPQLAAARSREELAALLDDPARHRLGAEHFANLGLLVTRFAERNRDRLRYFFVTDTSDAGLDLTGVGYRQHTGAGLLAVGKDEVYPSGVAWLDPNDGRIGMIVEEFRVKNTRYWVEVSFARDAALGTWLPARILVRVFEKGRLAEQNTYSYRHYRRLTSAIRADTAETAPRP